jgi:hypothetical protein
VAADRATRLSVLRIAAAVFTGSALVALIGVLAEPEDEVWQLAGSGLSVSLAALFATPSMLLAERSPAGSWRMLSAVVGVVLVLISLVLILAVIWDADMDGEAFGICLAAAVGLAQTNLLVARRGPDESEGLGLLTDATIVCGLLLAGAVVIAIATDSDSETGARFLAAVAILDALGLVLIPVVRRLAPKDEAPAEVASAGTGGAVPAGRCSWVAPDGFDAAVQAAEANARLLRLERPGPGGMPGVAVFQAPDGTLSAIVSYAGEQSPRP